MYYLYILVCSDKSLYTGITNDIKRRMINHSCGKGSKYVMSRLPFKLIYTEEYSDKISAAKRERQIKGWSRENKIRILKLEVV